MPRPPRLHVPGGHYHVILRGNHREALFSSVSDRDVLNRIVAETVERFELRVHAFCWMTNHLHALIQISDRPLGESMKRIALRIHDIGMRCSIRRAIFSSGAIRRS